MRRTGFSLVELVVVLAIVALLAGLLVPRVTGVAAQARQDRIEGDLTTVLAAGQVYEKGRTQPLTSVDQLVEAGLLDRVPASPVKGYAYSIRQTDQGLTAALEGKEGVYEINGYKASKTADGFYPG
jgi:prepilin-type N-terminal cleavage/methylation domain-containing protein